MNELNSSMEEAELSKTLKKLEILEVEKDDIVLGFIKEKEIIEAIHQEQLEQLKIKHEDEVQVLRREWLNEREKLLLESDSRQVDAENHNEKKTKEIEKKLIRKSKEDFKETEEELRKEKRKLREEYEAVISQKTSEIEELYRENCILRSKSDPGSFEDKNKESEVMINKLQSKISALEEGKLAQITKLKNEFELEKAELEREQVREKAEFVKQLTSKYDQQNTNNEIEKNKSFLAYKQEMKEKIEIVENLWEERNTEDRIKMITRLENEIAMQKQRFAEELQAKLLERDMAIEDLEREKEELAYSVHVERFELAKTYNRELSILNRLDSPTKEDIEVALIDEVAKLRDEQQKVIRNLEKRHKRKMRDLKKSQKPLAEIEEQHKNELEELRNNYEREKEEFETKLRNEQLNLLKSFEFEKNDIERFYKQHMEEQESEFQHEIQEIQSEYDEVRSKLDFLENENDKLISRVVQEKERNGELFDKLQECESKNARLKEEIERDKRSMREPVREVSPVDNDNEGLKKTVEKLSSLNIQLSDELEKERKKYENLLEKVHELETEQERLMTRSEADEVQFSESGLELSTSPTEKPDRITRENDGNTDTSSAEGKKSGESEKKSAEPNKEDLDMQMKLQDSVQEYLLEIKVLQNAMDEKEMEIKQLKDKFAKEKSDSNGQIQDLTDSLRDAVDDEDGANEEDIEELKFRYKKLTDSINQVIKDLVDKPSSPQAPKASDQPSISEPSSQQKDKSFANEVNALDEVLNDVLDPEKLGKKLEAIKNNITRSHELEKLEQERKHEQEKNKYLRELSDERHKELNVSREVWDAVCDKLGLDKEESKDKLKEILQEKDVPKEDLTSQIIESEAKGKYDDDGNADDKETKEEASQHNEELKKLKGENESLRQTLQELQKHYEKDKEQLMEKLQTQHREFVLSSEAEVIEKLIKEKSALEEESIIERFNLGRIYYMEMQDELEEILSQRKEDMNKEHEKEKLNIVLKFNKDIADLHKLLADKDENEVKLVQEKNALAKKMLDVQRKMPEEENDENNNIDDIKAEAKKLEASLPLKMELADLQRQRQDEHEASVQNLEKALDLIKDLLNNQSKGDDSRHRRYSFVSVSSQSDGSIQTDSPSGQRSPTLVQEPVLPDEEIRTKEDLQRALGNLIYNCLPKEKDEAESDSSSGASSDFETEPNSPPNESEEVVSDSGAESIESECVSIKKADLEMAMNLERFSLGRIYYNEYKDDLKSTLKKLAELKDINRDLEDKLSSGVQDLVSRTVFGKMMVQSVDIYTQTVEIEDSVKKTLDDLSFSYQKDIPLDRFPEPSEQEDVKENKVDEYENVKQDSMSNDIVNDAIKENGGTQTDQLQDNTKSTEQANEDKEIGDMKEHIKQDATTQTDDFQDHTKTTKEAIEEKGIEDKQNDEIEDAILQKEDGVANSTGIEDQEQSKEISSEASPREEENKNDKTFESVYKPETSHMLGQETPLIETAHEGDFDNEPESSPVKEEANADDSRDKETEEDDTEQEQASAHGDEKPFDEDKHTTETKEEAEQQEENANLDDEKSEDAAKANQSNISDIQDQFPKEQGRTSDEDITEEPEADDQPLDESDVETLKRENEKLKDKFNILKALVGKWFVEEIPGLKTVEKIEQKKGDSSSDDLGDDELKKLREEEKCLADEIKAIEKEILQVKDLNDANNKKEEEELNAQELLALKQLEKADKALKKEEEKDLIELLKKEKEEVGKKLKELEMEIKEHQDQISDDEKGLFDLMSKKLELEERVALKARQLDKNQKKMAQMQDDTEREKVDEAVNSLTEQKKVLEELLASPLSIGTQEEILPITQQPSEVGDDDNKNNEAKPSDLPLKEAHISPHVKELIKTKNNEEKKNKNLTRNIEKAKRDKDRYIRMAKDREDRLRPFIKKREKLQKSLREGEAATNERSEDEILSPIVNRESDTPNETADERTVLDIKVEDIEREMTKIRDELSSLGKKAKIPLAMRNDVNVLPSKLEKLELEKDMIDQQITDKQSTIENLGSEEATEVFNLLETKAKLDFKLLELQEAFPEGYEDIPREVQEAYELACLKQEIQNALGGFGQEIKDEENNFREAVIYQRQGKLDDPHSAIEPILERKQNLALELEEISSNLPCGAEVELVDAEAVQSKSGDANKRIREIEGVMRQIEDSIKDEPLRAAEELGKLIESKQDKTDELIKVADALKENIKMAELKENELEKIPGPIQSAIALEKETDENDLSFETVERENDIKERCLELQSLKSEGEDTKHKEDELLNLIEKQILKDAQPALDKDQKSKAFDPLPACVFAENKSTKSELENIEVKLEAILESQSEKENLRPELNDLGSLFQKKVEIEEKIKDHKEFEDFLNQERKLAKALKKAVNKEELEEIEQVIERKEEETDKIEAKSNEVEEMLEQLNDAKNNNEQNDDKLTLIIEEAIKETEQLLVEAEAEKESYYQNTNQGEIKVKEAMSSLEDELEETREEMEFVENELEGLRSISEDDSAVSTELLELTKLLNSQKSLKDYLLEIDTKLDDCDDGDKPSLEPEEVQALKEEKRDAERKLKEIQEQKSKFEVELQDEDIQENYVSLCEEKSKLEQARNELLHKIHGSDVFVQMADELEEEEPSEEEQKYYTQALNQMLSDQKTLIKLAEENEKLKDVACRQRELLENLSNSISASLGKDLAQAIELDSNLDENENLQLPRAIMDRISNDETIAEMLNELEYENKKLITLNEELLNELDCLKERIGETLSDAVLQSNSQLLEDKMMAPIDEVMNADKTVEEILEEQKDALGRLKDVIGEDLTDTLLKPKIDVSGTEDHQGPLNATKIMHETDEDLQTVIAAYEFELDNLGKENDVLKSMLGNDLVHALLDIDKNRKNKPIPEYEDDGLAEKGKRFKEDEEDLEVSQSYQKEISEGKETPFVQDDYADKEAAKLESEASKRQLSTDLKPIKTSNKAEEIAANREDRPQESYWKSLQGSSKPVASDKSEMMFSEIPKSSQEPLLESDGMTAPVRMVKDNKTLGEVIKDYENELDTLKFRLGPGLYQEILDAGASYKDDDRGLLVAQEREIESKQTNKPLDDAAINKEARKGSDAIKENISPGEQKDLNEQTSELRNKFEDKHDMLPVVFDSNNTEDKVTTEEHEENVIENNKLDGSVTEEKILSAQIIENEGRQPKPKTAALAAPKKMVEKKQSLAEVIEGYEKDLETLKSRLGQELYQDILDAGQQSDAKGESEEISEEAQYDACSQESGNVVASQEDSIISDSELEDRRDELASLETKKHDLRRSKGAQPDDLDHTQLTANTKGQADELEETSPVKAEDNSTTQVDDRKQKAPASAKKQKESSELKAKKPLLVAPKRMVEEKKSLAEVIEGYEKDLETLKSRLGQELYQDILDAGQQSDAKGASEAISGEAQYDGCSQESGDVVASQEDSINFDSELEDRRDELASLETKEHDLQRSKGVQPDDLDHTQLTANTKGQADELEETSPIKAEDNSTTQVDDRKQNALASVKKQKESSELKAKKSLLIAPKRMVEEKKSLAEVIEGYEKDLETLKSRLGQELYQDILGAGQQSDAKGESEEISEEAQYDACSQESGDVVASQEDSINFDSELEDRRDELASLETKKHDLQRSKGAQLDDLDHTQLTANTKAQADELEETSPIKAEDNSTTQVDDRKQKAPASTKKQKESSELKAKMPLLVAPKRMIEENQTLAEVVGGYEDKLEILKSRLGPELYDKILDAGKIANTDLLRPGKKTDPFAGNEQSEISGKVTAEAGDTTHESQDKERIQSMLHTGVLESQEKTSKDDASPPTESGENAKGSGVFDEKIDLEVEGMKEEQKRDFSMQSYIPAPLTRASNAQSDKIEISAPKHMIEDNKTLEEVIKDYESDLETLESKLGPQLFTSLLCTSNLGDKDTQDESLDIKGQSNVFTEKQPSGIRTDDRKVEGDSTEDLGDDIDQEENLKKEHQEKDLESSLSEGEAYLSDGELYESFNIQNVKKGDSKSKPTLDDKLKFSAPSIMDKEEKTLGEVLESYENDLEALKSKLGPKLFDHVLEIAKQDGGQVTAEMAKQRHDSKTQNQIKEPYTVQSTQLVHEKATEDFVAEKEHSDKLDYQETGTYDDEPNGKEKGHRATEEKGLESEERAVTSIDNNGSELLSKEYDLVAPKQMLEENKTLEEIIENYENDLRDLRESLGPQLCDAILNAKKGINESSDAATMALGKGESETEMDYLEQTTDEKGKKAASLKTEIGRVISEGHPREAFENAEEDTKNICGTSETRSQFDTQNEQQAQYEEEKDTSDFDRDVKDQRLADQNLTTQELQAPKMIAQGKNLDEIICGYENELGALKSRIGPNLYKDIVNAGKPEQNYERVEILEPQKPRKDNTDEQPIEKVDQDFNQDMKDEKEKVEYSEISSSMDDTTHEKPVAQEKYQNDDKEDIKKAMEFTKQQEMDDYLDMLENDVTLEDVINKLKKESRDLKEKLGPNLSKILLGEEQIEKRTEEEEEKRKEKEVGDNETKDKETLYIGSKGQRGSPSLENEKAEHLDSEENTADTAELQEVKCKDGKTDKITEDYVSPSDLYQKTFMATKLMEAQNAPLEDVIQNYEHDLTVLKKALGPNLVNLLLSDEALPAADNLQNLSDAGEDKETTKTQQDKEKTRGLEKEANRANEKDNLSEEQQRRVDEDEKQEKTGRGSDREGTKGTEGECLIQTELQESKDLEKIISPLLSGDKNESLEGILRTLHNDRDVLTSKLGSNLSKCLLTMDADSYDVSKDKDLSDDGVEEGKVVKLDLEAKDEDEDEKKSKQMKDQEAGKDAKELEMEEKETDDILGTESPGEEVDDLAALDQMEENSQTLEGVIKQYENNLERYESTLGPHLSKAIVSRGFTPIEAAEQRQAKSDADEKIVEQDVPLDEKEMKLSKLDDYLKLLDEGNTLEDLLIRYDPEDAVITDKSVPTSDQIKRLQKQNHGFRQELDNLKCKLGEGLVNQLQSEKDEFMNKDKEQDAKSLQEQEKETPDTDEAEIGGVKLCLEAPTIMVEDNRTLEDIVAQYENDLKEKTNIQEQLEHSIGPQLFRELCELKRLDGGKEDVEEKLVSVSEEEAEEPSSKKPLPESKNDVVNKMAKDEKPLEAVLGDYENDLEALERENASLKQVLEGVSGDGVDLGEMISKYENQITMQENAKKGLREELDNLKSKLGEGLVNQIQSKKDKDVTKDTGQDSKSLQQHENETPKDDVNETGDGKSCLEAPTIMAKDNRTLEDIVAEYENELKEKTNIKEQLEHAIGPELFKELCELERQEGEKGDVEEKLDPASEEEPKEPSSKKPLPESKYNIVNKMAEEEKPLEAVLGDYESDLEAMERENVSLKKVLEGVSGDGVDLGEMISKYENQITMQENAKKGLREELDNLKSKLGEGLVNQIQSKKDKDVTKDTGQDSKSLQQHEKETPKDDVNETGDGKSCLEAPTIMAKDNRTLEDIVAEYENELKEKTNIKEQLEHAIGPELFKELRELERQEGEKGDVEEKLDSASEEEPKEPSSKKPLPESKYNIVNKMAEEEKPLEAVLEDYENDLEALERENASLKKALEGVSGDGVDLGEMISKYENQITMLENAKKEAENDFEDRHNELQNEIDDLRATLEKLAQTLRQDFLDDLMKQDSDNHIEALQIMEKENKTLAEVVEEYEENMKKLEREKAVLQQIAGQSEEGASMLNTVNDYEDAIKGLKEVNKVLNRRIDALTDKLGPQLTEQIMDLCDEEKPSETGEKDDKKKDENENENETMAAVKEMEDRNITLEEVLKIYEDQNKKEIASFDNADQMKTSVKGDKEVEVLNVADNEGNQNMPIETPSTQIEDAEADLMSQALREKIGMQLIDDIKELDNKTFEELEKEDKRPYALKTMKARNEKLEDVIKAYENTLSNYGLLDSSTLKGESLAFELQAAIEEDVKVEEEVQYGAQASELINESKNDEENADGQDNDESKQIELLKKELEEEKALKEKYQKDAEDLLNDIVKLKMKNADGEEVEKEDIEKQIKEEYEQKQENKHLKQEMSKEKEKNKKLEDENNELKAEIRNMEKEIKNLEKAIEKMQENARGLDDGDVDGTIKELLVKNENLEKELEALKNQLKENEKNHKNEKNSLLEQFENEKRDTIKSLLDAKGEVEIKLQEQLALYHELEEMLKKTQEELDELRSRDLGKAVENTDSKASDKDEDKLTEPRMRNESLKEQLDLSEESMKDALQKYQDEIKALEVENAKIEDDKNHEIEILNNKLELEKAALERLKNDYDEMLKKEKERQMEDLEKDLEREKRRSRKDLEEQSEDFERKQNLHKQELQDAKEKAEREKEELRDSLVGEKEKLQKMLDEKLRKKDEEHEEMLNKLREQLEDQMITEKAEMNVHFRQEKTELKTQIEKDIYGDELQKNIDLEKDFQETLNKVLKDHANEIEDIEKEMAQAEERFKDQKLQLLEEFENEKLIDTKQHEKEKQEMESTIENLLKEIIKLKHQRKEMRQQYRLEKQSIEEISEKERIEIQENMERSKNDLVQKLKQDHEKEMENEKEKYEAVIKELQEALERAEAKKKELEEKLRSESLKAEESLNNRSVDETSSKEVTREVKVIKRGIEMEYEQKLSIEKQRFEDTLQGLRREVGNLQEKRKIIQERVYNQETHSTERQFIEKSIANYKMEVLSKLEGEMAQKIERERKPLEEEVRELQIENEELKRQRWEMKAQFRREKAALEEEFEREKEALENNLNKEKEELRKRLEAKLQKEKQNKALGVKVTRSTSPVLGEPSPRIDNTVRMLKQENLSLVSQNAKHEIDIEQLNEKLKFMEMNFQDMMETEKLKTEKMKKIQEQIPKGKAVDPTLPAPEYKPPSTGNQDDAILHTLQEKDQQIHQLLETKKYYESVFGELCDEAGLFELDRNQIV